MVWLRGVLEFNFFKPGVFSGRLIEVAVDADVVVNQPVFPQFAL